MTIDGGNVCIGGAGGMSCLAWPLAAIYLGSVAVVLAIVLGVLVWDARRTPTPSEAAARANRHATLASVVGVAAMVVILMWVLAGFAAGGLWRDGRVLAAIPALAGASLLVAQAIGQLTWPRPSGAVREAELTPRTVADVAPVWPRRLVLAWAGTALLALAVFGVVADGPRSMTREAGRYSESIGPYPGWYYGVPMALAVLATVAATELVLRLITARPAVAGVAAEWDAHLRRRSAGHVTRGVQLVLGITTAGVLVAAGNVHLLLGIDWVQLAAGGFASYGSPTQTYLGHGLRALATLVLLVAMAGTVAPLHRRAQDAPARRGATVPS